MSLWSRVLLKLPHALFLLLCISLPKLIFFLHLTAIITVVLHSIMAQNHSIISSEKHKHLLYFKVCEYDFSGYTKKCKAVMP